MKFLILILIVALTFTGCGKKEKVYQFNSKGIEYLVSEAARGNRVANDSLSNLFDLNLPSQSIINKIEIDSLKNISGKTYYAVLVEFPNPFFNRF